MKRIYINIIAIVSIIVIIIIINKRKKDIEEKGIYTIGKIIEFEEGPKLSYVLTYNFTYKDLVFTSDDIVYKNRKYLVGRRYIIKFIPDNPKISEIIYDKRIWCDTLKAPYHGWKEIPDYFPFYSEMEGFEINNCLMYKKGYYEEQKKGN